MGRNSKIGRPSSYDASICERLLTFMSKPHTHKLEKTYTTKAGTVIVEPFETPTELPTVERFMINEGLNYERISQWKKRYASFADAYARAKLIEKDHLVQNALAGRYNAAFAQFVACNLTDMRLPTQALDVKQSPTVLKPGKTSKPKKAGQGASGE